jgi:iron(III) transport system permease protein
VSAVADQRPEAGNRMERLFANGTVLGFSPVVLLLVALLLVALLSPILYLVRTSFYTTEFDGSFGEFTLEYYSEIVTNPRVFQNLLNTVIYALGSTAVAITLGAMQAWIVERTNTPLRQYFFLVSVISLSMPNVLYTSAWVLIFGKTGPINELLKYALGTNQALFNVNSLFGMILIEGFAWSPLAFLLLSSTFRAFDAAFEEAAMTSGAGVMAVLRRITLGLALPGLLALVMLIFIRAFESFEVPALVGMPGRVRVLTTDIYQAVHVSSPINYGQAAAFSVLLLLIVSGLLRLYNRLSRYADRFQTITGKGTRVRVIDIGRWRYLTMALLIFVFFLLIVLPVSMLLLVSLLPYYSGMHPDGLKVFTLENYSRVWSPGAFRNSIANSLILGASTATIVTLLTAVLAWLVARRYKGSAVLDQLATLPLIVPSIVMGVAFLKLFLALPFEFYGTLLSVICAMSVQLLPYGMRYAYAGVLQINRELEEAAATAGADAGTTFRRIIMPLLMPALLSCWLFVLLLSVRAVAMPILLVGPSSPIVSVSLFELWTNGQTTELSAMGLSWMALMVCVSATAYVAARKSGVGMR